VTTLQAFAQGRAERRTHKRDPVLAKLARFVGQHTPAYAAVQRFVLTLAGLVLVSAAAFTVALGLGLLVSGMAVLVLEWLTGGDSP